MRLRIEHVTTYRYRRPVRFGRHRLVLRPREGHDLRVEQMQLELSPSYRLSWLRDVFGNSVALVDWLEPSDVLSIVNTLEVQRRAPFPIRELHEPWVVPFPPEYDALERAVTAAYLRYSFEDSEAAIRAWLSGVLKPDAQDAEGTVLALCRAVHETVGYRRRDERGVQTPARTLELGTGSCRDLATLLMESARRLGVAARFASGYLHGTASMAGHASTHAWCEVYLPRLGWRGFDPTLGRPVDLPHVVTGVSEHPRGVMPVSGAFHGVPGDCLSMTVSVRTVELPSVIESPPPE